MSKQYVETLVVAGPHLQDLYETITTQMEKIPPGELEIKRASNRKLIIRSYNPFTAVLAYLYDRLKAMYPKNEFVLASWRDGDDARVSGYRKGTSLFEGRCDYVIEKLPRTALPHRHWVQKMLFC